MLERDSDNAHAYNAFALYGYTVSEPMPVLAGSEGLPPAPIPALPEVLVKGELVPSGPLASAPMPALPEVFVKDDLMLSGPLVSAPSADCAGPGMIWR